MGVGKLQKDLRDKLRKACSQLRDKASLIVVCPPEKLNDVRLGLMKYVLEETSNGVYVSLNKPSGAIDESLRKSGLKTSGLYYIDCITTLVYPGKADKKNPRVFHVGSPAVIAEEGLLPHEIERYIMEVPHPKFIVVDTLRTLLLYNKHHTVESFMRHLHASAREMQAKLAVLTIVHPDDKAMKDIVRLFDVILNISD